MQPYTLFYIRNGTEALECIGTAKEHDKVRVGLTLGGFTSIVTTLDVFARPESIQITDTVNLKEYLKK